MTRLNIPLRGDVCGKVRYHSEREARSALADLRAAIEFELASVKRGELRIYCCERCGGCWHVGHKREPQS
jgi:hypothetical protein